MRTYTYNKKYVCVFIICYDNILHSTTPILDVVKDLTQTVTPLEPHIWPLKKVTRLSIFLSNLKLQGFSVKEGYSGQWTSKEEKAVSKFMKEYLLNSNSISYFDIYTNISRKILNRSKSRVKVKKFLVTQLKTDKKWLYSIITYIIITYNIV